MSSDSADEDARWFCLRTQTKREHVAAASLANLPEVEAFCPRIRFKKPTRRGVIWWVEPLFPGYLLAKFRLEDDLRAVLHTNGIRGAVQFGGRLPTVPKDFVDELRREFLAADEEAEVLTVEHRLGIGDEVEVLDGAFQGLTGRVVEVIPSSERVNILLEFLGEDRPVEVDVFSLLVRERSD